MSNFNLDDAKNRVRFELAKTHYREQYDPAKAYPLANDPIEQAMREAGGLGDMAERLDAYLNRVLDEKKTASDAAVAAKSLMRYSFVRWHYDPKAKSMESRAQHTSKTWRMDDDAKVVELATSMIPQSGYECVDVLTPDGRRLVLLSPNLKTRIEKDADAKSAFDRYMLAGIYKPAGVVIE